MTETDPKRRDTQSGVRPTITIRRARAHNLKGFDLVLPSQRIVAVTGPSGSGKSSLVFDTLHVEATRRYLEHQQNGFDIEGFSQNAESIEGLSPTVMLKQTLPAVAMQASVGRFCGIEGYLKALFAQLGRAFCQRCGAAIDLHSLDDMSDVILARESGTRFILCAPAEAGSAKHTTAQLVAWREQGFLRVHLNDQWLNIDEALALFDGARAPEVKRLAVVVDRLSVDANAKSRLLESLRLATRLSGGIVDVYYGEDVSVRYTSRLECPGCGARYASLGFSDNSPTLKLNDKTFADLGHLSAHEVVAFLRSIVFEAPRARLAASLVSHIATRVQRLTSLGIDHLTLNRRLSEISRGELQRLRLAHFLGDMMSGLTYLFDEPSTGLHAEDLKRVNRGLRALCEQGNTVIVVEHDRDVIHAADHVVELGPGAGNEGGSITFQGNVDRFIAHQEKDTLARRVRFPMPKSPGELVVHTDHTGFFTPTELRMPRGRCIVVTGLSGSGKTRLLLEEVLPALSASGGPRQAKRSKSKKADDELLGQVLIVDQSAVVQANRSTPATFMQIMEPIRDVFASMPLARARGFKGTAFSLNHRAGRCETCEGRGDVPFDVSMARNARVECPTCHGKRFMSDVLEVTFRGFNIGDVLSQNVQDAAVLFAAISKARVGLEALKQVGLGYLALGQPVDSLSGGEIQRLRLAYVLARAARVKDERRIFILDEPSAGLGQRELVLLTDIFHELAQQGHTILMAEHHLELVAFADHVIELEANAAHTQSQVVFNGSREAYENAATLTARNLQAYLKTRRP